MTVGELKNALRQFRDEAPVQREIERLPEKGDYVRLDKVLTLWSHYSIKENWPNPVVEVKFLPKTVATERVEHKVWRIRTTVPAWT